MLEEIYATLLKQEQEVITEIKNDVDSSGNILNSITVTTKENKYRINKKKLIDNISNDKEKVFISIEEKTTSFIVESVMIINNEYLKSYSDVVKKNAFEIMLSGTESNLFFGKLVTKKGYYTFNIFGRQGRLQCALIRTNPIKDSVEIKEVDFVGFVGRVTRGSQKILDITLSESFTQLSATILVGDVVEVVSKRYKSGNTYQIEVATKFVVSDEQFVATQTNPIKIETEKFD